LSTIVTCTIDVSQNVRFGGNAVIAIVCANLGNWSSHELIPLSWWKACGSRRQPVHTALVGGDKALGGRGACK